jgi:hypothetical protein
VKKFSVNTAPLTCNKGTNPGAFTVTSQNYVYQDDLLLGTEKDINALVNIPSFGSCMVKRNAPCIPSPQPWQQLSDHLIDDLKKLTDQSCCMCAFGGKISFKDCGQTGSENAYEEN